MHTYKHTSTHTYVCLHVQSNGCSSCRSANLLVCRLVSDSVYWMRFVFIRENEYTYIHIVLKYAYNIRMYIYVLTYVHT